MTSRQKNIISFAEGPWNFAAFSFNKNLKFGNVIKHQNKMKYNRFKEF